LNLIVFKKMDYFGHSIYGISKTRDRDKRVK